MSDGMYTPERRPIASRERKLSKQFAHALAIRGVSPNRISLVGLLAGIAGGMAMAVTAFGPYHRLAFFAAAVLMQFRLLANMLDGMVAAESGRASPLGELWNEVPDRVCDVAAFIGAGYAAGGDPTLGFVAACLALFLAYLRAEGKVAGAHQEFCGPMAKPQRVFALTLVALYSALAPSDWQPRLADLPEWGLVAWGLVVIICGEIWTVVRRLKRIAQALREMQP